MQTQSSPVPSGETEATHKLYGIDQDETRDYGTRCLIARRLIERGVRFVQLFLSGQPWDTHSKNAETLKSLYDIRAHDLQKSLMYARRVQEVLKVLDT